MLSEGFTQRNTKLLCEQQTSNKLLLSAFRPDSSGSIEREKERERVRERRGREREYREREREKAKWQREQVLLCVSRPDST